MVVVPRGQRAQLLAAETWVLEAVPVRGQDEAARLVVVEKELGPLVAHFPEQGHLDMQWE